MSASYPSPEKSRPLCNRAVIHTERAQLKQQQRHTHTSNPDREAGGTVKEGSKPDEEEEEDEGGGGEETKEEQLPR